MTGDFTSVPLRPEDRWTAARMQQGRVLLDTDWNLTIDGAARETRGLARDTIGFAGVPQGSSAFRVDVVAGVLTVRPGLMWIGGLAARNSADLAYGTQPEVPPLPATGLALVYLDAFDEGVQAAEDPELLDPALDGVDTTTRTRVGWRVRIVPAASAECGSGTLPASISTGTLDVTRTSGPVSTDPCAPPDDPRSKLPDGLLRIEVIDGGSELTARFAWSYAGGGDAVAASVAGTAVTLVPSASVAFRPGELAEVSTLARRADRRNHGALHTVAAVTPQAGGDLVTLATPSPVTGDPPGTCLRRWDGQTVGAASGITVTLGAADVGIAFTARPGTYMAGDWWGVRVRGSASDAVETRTAAPPDGVVHASAPLAVVDLTTMTVLTDCRRTFPHLVDIRGGTCTVVAFPGDDLQAALDALPVDGGKLCLAAGTYPVRTPLTISGKRRIVIAGVGPATILVADRHEAVLVAKECDDIEVTHLRAESAVPSKPSPPGERHLLGALTFLGGSRVRVRDCQVRCPDSGGRAQSGIYVTAEGRTEPGWVEIRGNRLEIGARQVGVLITSARVSTVVDNDIMLGPRGAREREPVDRSVARELGRFLAQHLHAEGGEEGEEIVMLDGTKLRVSGPTNIRRFIAAWGRAMSTGGLERERSLREALEHFAVASLVEPHEVTAGASSTRFLRASVRDIRAIGQGIVVGGSRAGLVRIEGNTVLDTLQAIHVGLHEEGPEHATAERVIISGNVVGCRVPYFWMRQRHAIYVGNVNSLTIVDNRANLARTGGSTEGTSVDAVRVWGLIGPFLQVRGLDLTGDFRFGVLVRDTTRSGNRPRMVRHISDVLNLDGAQAVSVPATVTTERCVP
ncbi:DUF6519 domain-containing protein [Arthrobacter sp. OV608]|uniref:DUF6519 domain-containing protein n=1 Tax=Arthrobacter sp. OV608 TaxID=1882768 RepID=UPI0008CC4B3B|nr:DUF6519 domain-containing protein [Arthrobacter sp. OV608]SEQ80397.1 hypothetical protein SAMN05444745_11167 [Arthrobacter sp. OV608]